MKSNSLPKGIDLSPRARRASFDAIVRRDDPSDGTGWWYPPAACGAKARRERVSGQPPTGYRHERGRVHCYRSLGLRHIADRV